MAPLNTPKITATKHNMILSDIIGIMTAIPNSINATKIFKINFFIFDQLLSYY